MCFARSSNRQHFLSVCLPRPRLERRLYTAVRWLVGILFCCCCFLTAVVYSIGYISFFMIITVVVVVVVHLNNWSVGRDSVGKTKTKTKTKRTSWRYQVSVGRALTARPLRTLYTGLSLVLQPANSKTLFSLFSCSHITTLSITILHHMCVYDCTTVREFLLPACLPAYSRGYCGHWYMNKHWSGLVVSQLAADAVPQLSF